MWILDQKIPVNKNKGRFFETRALIKQFMINNVIMKITITSQHLSLLIHTAAYWANVCPTYGEICVYARVRSSTLAFVRWTDVVYVKPCSQPPVRAPMGSLREKFTSFRRFRTVKQGQLTTSYHAGAPVEGWSELRTRAINLRPLRFSL